MDSNNFYTFKGYELNRRESHGRKELSPAMEDYLEMISRCGREGRPVRVNTLAARLHVTPPSASKMVGRLRELGMVQEEHYGAITLTEEGIQVGNYLLYRHQILHKFFCLLNHRENELELVEKIEHFIDQETLENLENLLQKLPP